MTWLCWHIMMWSYNRWSRKCLVHDLWWDLNSALKSANGWVHNLMQFGLTWKLREHVEFVPELLLFGTKLSFDNTNDVELNHRISKGWMYFWPHKGLFCNNHAALKSRFHVWGFTCRRCIMWCTEIMAWTNTQLRIFHDLQVGMTARMLNLRRRWQGP